MGLGQPREQVRWNLPWFKCNRRTVLVLFDPLRVVRECHRNARVAELLGDVADRYACGEQVAGVAVPEVFEVEIDPGAERC